MSKFSDFIRNASVQEKEIVYNEVMDKVAEEQERIMYTEVPDNWVVLKIKESEGSFPFYKVLAGWSGGYLGSDCWKMNSGIVRVDRENKYSKYIDFYGKSGSVYHCHKDGYGLRMNNAGIYNKLKEQQLFEGQVVLMPNDTDWFELEWNL